MANTSEKGWTAGQLRQKVLNSKDSDLKLVKDAGLLPKKVGATLSLIEHHYDPEWSCDDPECTNCDTAHYAWNTERYQQIVRFWTTKTLRDALNNGKTHVINHFLGIVESETDISGIKVYERFSKWVEREAGINYLAGHMGAGKTDLALLMAEIFYTRNEDVKIGTNIKSCAEEHEFVDFIGGQADLVEWLEADDRKKYFIFDEGSSHASGYAEDASSVTKQFRSIINLIRKKNGRSTIIGHSGKDIHPHVRRLADYIQKNDKKDSTIFEEVKEGKGQDKKFDLSNIPQTSLSYDTLEESTWDWVTEDGQDGQSIDDLIYKTLRVSDMSQKEIADIFEVSQAHVSDIKRERENGAVSA